MDKRVRRRVPGVFLVALIAVALGVSACGGSSSSSSSSSDGSGGGGKKVDAIKIAVPMDLTGAGALFGKLYLNSMKWAAQQINDQGGIKSLGGAKLDLMVGDTESDPTRGVQLIREMNQKGAVVSIGPISSAVALGVKPTLTSLKMPFVMSTLEPAMTQGDTGGNMFRITGPFNSWGEQTMDFLEKQSSEGKIKIHKIGILTIEVPPGPALRKVLVERAKKAGWEVTDITYNPAETRDFSAIVAKLRDANVDVVTGLNYANDAILFGKAVALQSWRPSGGFVSVAGGQVQNEFRSALGNKARNWINATYGGPDSKCAAAKSYATAFQKEYGEPPVGVAWSGPAVVQVVASALEKAASTDRDKVREAIKSTTLGFCQGLYFMAGGVKFDEHGDNAGWVPTMIQHEGTGLKQVSVWPTDIAGQAPTWPAYDK